jgi:hypothetical protein
VTPETGLPKSKPSQGSFSVLQVVKDIMIRIEKTSFEMYFIPKLRMVVNAALRKNI